MKAVLSTTSKEAEEIAMHEDWNAMRRNGCIMKLDRGHDETKGKRG